jgi:hypothetical protein
LTTTVMPIVLPDPLPVTSGALCLSNSVSTSSECLMECDGLVSRDDAVSSPSVRLDMRALASISRNFETEIIEFDE